MADVFVSYNREDLETARRIVDTLIQEGLDVWLDMDLRAGENYDEITEERLRGARAVVVLWSSRSVKSRWVRAEATIGARRETLVPAMIEDCERPVMFELIQTTDLSSWTGDRTDPHWLAFVEVIRRRIAAAPPGPLFATGQGKAAKTAKDAKAKKKVRPAQPAQKKSGAGVVSVFFALILFTAVIGGGLYLWRPQLFEPLFASISSGRTSVAEATAPPSAETAPAILGAAPSTSIAPVEAAPAPAAPLADESPRTVETAAPAAAAPATFRECDVCPEMINISGGVFQMGSPDDELGRKAWEGPQRKVAMAPFAIGAAEVTFDQWDACVADGGCGKYKPNDRGLGRADRPVVEVSWQDATLYAQWLTKKTGRVYRLPSEAEWEYAGRGGATTPFWWGPLYDATKAAAGSGLQSVGALPANMLGLRGVTGNAREWVQDCYVNTFANAPLDGRSVEVSKCAVRVVRGGAYIDTPEGLRIAVRARNAPAFRDKLTSFRIAAAP